jgi:hypothetical protein
MPGMAIGVVVASLALLAPGSSSDATPQTGQLTIVQAVPGTSPTVSLDGEERSADAGVGAVLGPYDVPAGRHDIVFADGGGTPMTTTVTVRAGSASDVVLHRPAAVGGDPVVNVYRTPMAPIGSGMARVLLAHTATVPPADVRVDGKTVFTNIANGEFAQADVPAGTHEVALLPTGSTTDPLLGPLDVTLKAGTVTMVYAVGTPRNGSMDVIAHVERLGSDGAVAPDRIETGSAGLVASVRVVPSAAR